MAITPVTPEISRSPEPETSDYDFIKARFKTVLMFEGDTKEIQALLPVAVISEPISFWQMHWPPSAMSASRLDGIVDMINALAKPLLVHCKAGHDRTGLACAAYRVKYMHWTPKAAMDEAEKLGYGDFNFGLNKTWKEWSKSYEQA